MASAGKRAPKQVRQERILTELKATPAPRVSELAQEFGALRVKVVSDSELMVRQLNGAYRVKSAALLSLYRKAKGLADGFDRFRIRHVLRSKNRDADRLANEGILNSRLASGPDGRARKGEESPSSTGQDAG